MPPASRAPWLVLVALGLAGCVTSAGVDAPSAAPTAAPEPVLYEFEGEFLAGGVDAPVEFEFDVPNGTGEVAALLTWTIPGAVLDVQLLDPAGEVAADGWAESDSHRYVTTTLPPSAGRWTAVVTAERGADAHFALVVEARAARPYGPIGVDYEVPALSFAEVNLNMAPGDFFNFTWEATGDVYFNVHYHADGTTERPIEERTSALDGRYDAPATATYSLLWRNEGPLPVTVTGGVDGVYRVHSLTRDEPPPLA